MPHTPSFMPSLTTSSALRLRRVLPVGALSLCAAVAQAQDIDSIRMMPTAERQSAGFVGLGVATGPRYAGADDTRTRVLPVAAYYWANGWFASTLGGVGVNLSSTPGLQYGPRLTVDFGRKEDSDGRLHGMGNVNPAAELGGFVNYKVVDAFSVHASLRAGSGEDHKGVRVDLSASYGFQLAPGLRLRLGANTTLGNQAYAQTHFGVTSSQSANSGYAPYTPKAGFQDVRASIGLNYALAPRVMLSTTLTSTSLLGDAKDSPLVRKTSTVSGQIGVAYGF